MKMKQVYFILVIFSALAFNPYRKEDNITPLQAQVMAGDLIKTSFTGVVKDIQGNLLQGENLQNNDAQ
jgi:hypothetical protein